MKTYIWTLPTRFFHWLLALSFGTAYILGESESFNNWHFAFGALVGTLVVCRLLFGIIGPKYSNFRDFPIGLKNQVDFIGKYFTRPNPFVGHNPMASLVMLCILFVGLLCSISGYLLYSSEIPALSFGFNEDFLEDAHGVIANIFLGLVGIHLLGIIADTLFHLKLGTLQSIFTGYKNIESENVRLNAFHKTYILLWFLLPFYMFYLAQGLPAKQKSGEDSKNGKHELYKEDDE